MTLAVRSDVTDHLARLNREADVIHRADRLVFADKKILHRAPQALSTAEGFEFLVEIFDFDQVGHGARGSSITSAIQELGFIIAGMSRRGHGPLFKHSKTRCNNCNCRGDAW